MIATYKILRNVTPLAWDWNCEIAPLPKNMLHAIRDMFHTKICQVGVYIPNDLLLLVIQYLLPRLDDFTPGSGINCWDGWRTLRKINFYVMSQVKKGSQTRRKKEAIAIMMKGVIVGFSIYLKIRGSI